MLNSLDGLQYPLELRWVQAHGFIGLMPWWLLTEDRARVLRTEFQKETSTDYHQIHDILPFAYRQDQDDIAGFPVENDTVANKIVVVHLTWRQGPEMRGFPSITLYDSFWAWLKEEVITETSDWCSEEDLQELLARKREDEDA